MIQLQTLGQLDLRAADGEEIRAVLAQPKRLALLVYLVNGTGAQPRFCRRDTIVALFWPELDTERARAALRKAMHFLRGALGNAVFEKRGTEEIGVAPGAVATDVAEMERLIRAGENERALALYRGAFLDGVFFTGAPELERWVEAERERIRALAVSAALELAEQKQSAGDDEAARIWAEWAISVGPPSEAAVRRLMSFLTQGGDRAAAFAAYHAFAQRLADDYGITPSDETRALLETLRINATPSIEATVPTPPVATLPIEVEPEPVAPKRRRIRPTLFSLVLVLPLAALAWRQLANTTANVGRANNRVAVMPFEMRTAPELSYLSDGLAVLLSTRLDAGGPLHAINARSVLTVLERDKSISPEQLAARFDASLYVNGSVVQAGDTVEIDATLMDARGHGSLGHAHAVGPAQALFSLVDGLTRDLLAQYLRGNREQLASTAALTSGSLPALKAFLEGEELLRVARYGAAEDAFDRAIANDSMFALAYYRRSVARVWNGDIAAATSDAGRATQLSSRLGDRDKEIVGALFAARKGEAAEAERRYRTIVQRYPDEMEAWFEMADVIFHVAPARGGSISDARAAFQRVLAFEPDHQPAMVHLARIATVEGRTAALDTLTAKVLRLGPRGDHAAEMRLMRAVVLHDTAAEQALIRDVEEEGSSRLLDAAWRVSGYTREFGSMLRVMTRLSPYMHDEWRSGVLLLRSHLAARIGNDAVAAACLDSLRQSAPVAALATRAVFATSGLTPIDRAAVVLLRAEIAAANFGQRRATPDIYVGHSSPDTLEPAFKHFYLGMLSLKLDDARAAQAQLDSLVAVTETPQAENAVALLNASLLNRAGHRKAAISTLDTALDASGLRIITTTPFLPRPMIRYTLAQLLTADGKPDEAARIRGSLPEDFSFGVLFLAR